MLIERETILSRLNQTRNGREDNGGDDDNIDNDGAERQYVYNNPSARTAPGSVTATQQSSSAYAYVNKP